MWLSQAQLCELFDKNKRMIFKDSASFSTNLEAQFGALG
jgi:hypothetical protein